MTCEQQHGFHEPILPTLPSGHSFVLFSPRRSGASFSFMRDTAFSEIRLSRSRSWRPTRFPIRRRSPPFYWTALPPSPQKPHRTKNAVRCQRAGPETGKAHPAGLEGIDLHSIVGCEPENAWRVAHLAAASLFTEKAGGTRCPLPPGHIMYSPSLLALRYGSGAARRKNWFCPGTMVKLQGGVGGGIMLV